MHIAYLLSGFHSASGGGGAESYVSTMADALVERGHRVSIVAFGDSNESNHKLRLVKVRAPSLHWYLYRGLPFGKAMAMPLRELEWSRAGWSALMELHRRDPVDVVETGETMVLQQLASGNKPSLVVRAHGNPLAIKRLSGVPIRFGDRLGRRLQLAGMRRAAAITAVSKFQAEEIRADLSDNQTINVIPNPISPMLLQRALEKPRVETEKPVVLYTGRLEFRKGTLELLKSLSVVTPDCPHIEYVLAGARHNSISNRILQRALDQEGIRSHLRIVGHVAWQELPEQYRRATVFAMPSLYETFGISVIEAMAFGLPVVASNTGGLPEVVDDGVTGILVPPGDHRALGEAIVRLLRDNDLRARMGLAGQERVRAEFTVDQVVPRTLMVYESAVRSRAEAGVSRELTNSCAS